MKTKIYDRINPYPTTRDVASSTVWLFLIGGLFALPFICFFLTTSPFFFLVWLFPILLLSLLGQKIFDEFTAFRNRHRFSEISLVAEAMVLDKTMFEREGDRWYYVVIEFAADTINKGRCSQQLEFEIPQELYNGIEKGQTVVVRYSRLNSRMAILADEENYVPEKMGGEERATGIGATILFVVVGIVLIIFVQELPVKLFGGFMLLIGCLVFYFSVYNPEVAIVSKDSATPAHLEGRATLDAKFHKKQGIIAAEGSNPKIYQAYKLYAENGWLYGACILRTNEEDVFPVKKVPIYDGMDLNSDNFLTEDKYNFRYSLGELGSIQVSTKKRNFVGTRIVGKLVIRFMNEKERTFWLASDIEQAKEILHKAGFVVE